MANVPPDDELVQELVDDPTKIPNLVVLVGYLGRNSTANNDYWRLYSTAAMNDYIIFESTALVHFKDLPAGGSIVWLKGDTSVQHVRVETRKLQAEFLQGSITGDVRPSLPGLPGESGTDGNPWTMVNCPPSVWRC
jgi:hypothetical protein